MLTKDFNHTIDFWIKALEQNTFAEVCAKPSPTSWSLGQVCMHLVRETRYFLEQVNICLSTDDNALEEMSSHAKTMFRNNAFPDEVIEGPPTNANTPQPDSKEELLRCLIKLKEEINTLEVRISASPFKGKTKHPGLNYFNAAEWFQFAEMHLRHHLRQKKRIDEFLKTTRD
jgi:hypothetical protein